MYYKDIQVFGSFDSLRVTYRLRNCQRNEEALLRLAASAILSIDDYLGPPSKDAQRQTAADYLCAYKSKYVDLVNADKLVVNDVDPTLDPDMDLGSDAEDIVWDLVSTTCP